MKSEPIGKKATIVAGVTAALLIASAFGVRMTAEQQQVVVSGLPELLALASLVWSVVAAAVVAVWRMARKETVSFGNVVSYVGQDGRVVPGPAE